MEHLWEACSIRRVSWKGSSPQDSMRLHKEARSDKEIWLCFHRKRCNP